VPHLSDTTVLVKSTKQAYPGTTPPAGSLGFVRYFITAIYLCLCFGHYSAAALASAPQKGVIAFNYHQNHRLSCFIEYYNELCVSLPSASPSPSEIRIQGNCR
jgi:hypothetical protein